MADSPENDPPQREPDMADDALGLGLQAPQSPPPNPSQHPPSGGVPPHITPEPATAAATATATAEVRTDPAYRVLARKYRPQSFSQLIGQDAMIQTLGNAIKRDRLAHAFLMTGVRGVGKTSTARLIAKSLNCIGADGQSGPTIDPCGVCDPCIAIAEGRHIDVIEIDAASHNGIDDVRQMTDAVRYAAVSARYKMYIIDEVHMMSKPAFNALLKTLEEPPSHVKFLLATTEVDKVPITVLSRCQRFDLKRIPVDMLSAHFADILDQEGVTADPQALTLISQAAEGSVRDGLSILDQAIAHSDMARSDDADSDGDTPDGKITADQVRGMLGLSDRGAIRRLFALILQGDAQAMLASVAQQYALGVEPAAMLAGLLSEVHRLTLAKIGAPHDPALPEEARDDVDAHAGAMSFPKMHRLWQLLLKGHEEVSRAASPREACDMALLRTIHGASMPDPGELARAIEAGQGGGTANTQAPTAQAPTAQAAPPLDHIARVSPQGKPSEAQRADTPAAAAKEQTALSPPAMDTQGQADFPASFADLLDRLGQHNFINLEMALRDVMRVAEYSPPLLAYQISGAVPAGFLKELDGALKSVTGQRWQLEERAGEAPPTMYEIERAAKEADRQAVLESPLVKAALAAFPDAEILESPKLENENRSASA